MSYENHHSGLLRNYKSLSGNIVSQIESPKSLVGNDGSGDRVQISHGPQELSQHKKHKSEKILHGTSLRITFYLLNSCQLSRPKSQREIKLDGVAVSAF